MSYLSSLQGVNKQSGLSPDLWDAKLEPLSDSELDEWLLFSENNSNNEVNDPLLKEKKCETAGQILQNINELGKLENDYWVEESPLFEEIQSLIPFYYVDTESFVNIDCPQTGNVKVSNQNEDQSFFDAINKPEKPLNVDLESEISSILTSDQTQELSVVDEILQNTVLEINNWESDTSRSEISSDGGSPSEVSPRSIQEDESDDAEWKPEPAKSSRGRKNYYKKTKPYCRGGSQEDKRLRKKEQNKNAATRYRQKKKAEISELLKEEEELLNKKSKLEEKVSDLQNEIRYLKGLMRDLFKAKGLIN